MRTSRMADFGGSLSVANPSTVTTACPGVLPDAAAKFFNCSLGSYLHEFRLLPTYKMPNLEDIEFPLDVDFVSASSENHFNLSRGMIKRMREVHPTNKIIFYDLGLTARQVGFCS